MLNININYGRLLLFTAQLGKIKLYLLSLMLLLAVSSCKKELIAYPYHDITAFTIKDATGTSLEAAIVDNSITIYWPPFQVVPDSIRPQITVSDRATVTPASGTKVPFKSSITYTVKAQDGSTTVYHLKPLINQPPVDFVINTSTTLYADGGLYGSLQLSSQFFIPDATKTSFSLVAVSDSTKTYRLQLVDGSLSKLSATLNVPLDVPAGEFRVKAVSGYQSSTNEQIVKVIAPPLPNFESMELKKGQTFTVTGKNLAQLSSVFVYNDDYDEIHFTIVSQTDTKLTLKVPDDVLPGVLPTDGAIYLQFGDETVTFLFDGSITISE